MKEEIKKIKYFNCPLDLATRQFIIDFRLFIKQCYRIAWRVEKKQKVRIQKLQWQKTE